jgi:hypothetical protein
MLRTSQLLTRVQHNVNMDTPLLTRDGFPRADIDVAQSMRSTSSLTITNGI